MTLGDLISLLATVPPDTEVGLGFDHPHSYRGHYAELAFEPVEGTTAGDMLVVAKSALDSTYSGWKGGKYTMDEWSDVYLAREGEYGEPLTSLSVRAMLGLPLVVDAAREGE